MSLAMFVVTPPTLTLPRKGGGNRTHFALTPSPSMGEGRGGGDACLSNTQH
jgi:hypothetical protein